MQGQFIFSTCNKMGLKVKAIIRNSLRQDTDEERELRKSGMQVDLEFFSNGKSISKYVNFKILQLDEWLVLDEKQFPELADSNEEVLVVATCTLDKAKLGFFSQEHQVTYINKKTSFASTLLYDQLPIAPPGRPLNPIVLLAPKCWVGKDLDTYIVFACSLYGQNQSISQKITFYILNDIGNVVATQVEDVNSNGAFVYSLRDKLPPHLLNENIEFYSVCASGGQSAITISTFIVNSKSGTFALEHSLSPHYYLSGDLKKIRTEALNFSSLDLGL